LMEETVNIYRDEDYTASSRIGRGTVSRTAEVAVGADSSSSSSSNSGSGSSSSAASSSSGTVNSILTLHVKDGDTVERGQLLYETVTGSLDGLYATSNEIVSDVSGIVASVGASSGSSISKGNTLITVYPRDKMQVEIEIDEYDLVDIQEGDLMSLQFNYSDASTDDAEGTVSMISNVSASTDTSDVTYKAYVDFIANDKVRLGMTVVATVEDNAESDASAQPTESAASPAEDVQEATAE